MQFRGLWQRYGHGRGLLGGASKEALLAQALRDWRSGRAFWRNGRYWLRPLDRVAGQVVVGHGRATVAPWSKVAIAEYGTETRGLHDEAHAAYPHVNPRSLLEGYEP